MPNDAIDGLRCCLTGYSLGLYMLLSGKMAGIGDAEYSSLV